MLYQVVGLVSRTMRIIWFEGDNKLNRSAGYALGKSPRSRTQPAAFDAAWFSIAGNFGADRQTAARMK
jgi:hypothetical protein